MSRTHAHAAISALSLPVTLFTRARITDDLISQLKSGNMSAIPVRPPGMSK